MNGTRLFSANITPLKDKAHYDEVYAELTDYRKKTAEKYKIADDKIRSVGAGTLLARALVLCGHKELSSAEIVIGENGKPRFKDDCGVYFNISHSGDYVVCAVSDNDVGCDIELVASMKKAVVKRFFTPKEREFIESAERDEEKNRRFFRVWTLKESYVKAMGIGFYKLPSSFTTVPNENDVELIDDESDECVSFKEYFSVDGYALSLCVVGKLPEKCEIVEL